MTEFSAAGAEGQFSPDGKWIAYTGTGDRSARDIFVQPFRVPAGFSPYLAHWVDRSPEGALISGEALQTDSEWRTMKPCRVDHPELLIRSGAEQRA